MDRKLRVASTIGAALALAGALVAPAAATYPGDVGRLAFAMTGPDGNNDIYAALPNGQNLRRLTTDPGLRRLRRRTRPTASTSRSAATGPAPSRSGRWTRTAATSTPSPTSAAIATFPDYSPDGRKIVFDGDQGSDPNDEIYVVNARTGGGLTALTSCAGYGAGCFNDYPGLLAGRQEDRVHPRRRRDADGNPINEQVWVMSANGSNKTQLTFDANDHDQLPDWSPDGTKIAYEDGGVGAGRIFSMRADGSHQTQLTFGPGDDIGAAWSPDGRQIAFLRNSATATGRCS